MVTLYRGLRQQPVILTPEGNTGKSTSHINFFGGPQDFCDDEDEARAYAGEKGFVMRIELPEEVAKKYKQGPILITLSEDQSTIVHQVNRYEITGIELAQHIEDWKYRSINMQEGNSLKEKR